MGFITKLKHFFFGGHTPNKMSASGGYDGASGSTRFAGTRASILGPNTLTLTEWLQLVERSRHAVRNFPLAKSAQEAFIRNIIGTGIRPHFNYPDPDIRKNIQDAWDAWVDCADFNDISSFYGIQSVLAGSIFETGECFCRFHISDDDDAYFQLQLIETEQVPVFLAYTVGFRPGTVVKLGILFDEKTDKRIGYHLYKRQPYDTVIGGTGALNYVEFSTDEMIQVMKPYRVGALRGLPLMAAVLPLLYDIEGYADAERLRKRIDAMVAMFIENPTDEYQPFAPAITNEETPAGVTPTIIEPGTLMNLQPGQKITMPSVPATPGYADFMYQEIHKFSAGLGLTYEMVSGDMKGVNYSSARVALLEIRRGFEQMQQQIIVDQFCKRVLKKWMENAVLSGALELPGDYAVDPRPYETCEWIADGFEFVDPDKEVQAAQLMVEGGFTSKSRQIRKLGYDPTTIAEEIADERKQETELGIVTTTNTNLILPARTTQPLQVTQPKPDRDAEEDQTEDENSDA